jgi:teichuronic acid exporter
VEELPPTAPSDAAKSFALEESLTSQVRRSASWSTSVNLAIRIVRSILFIVLARLLAPSQFGLVALATVFTTLMTLPAVSGYVTAIIQRPEVDQDLLDTAFWCTAASAVVLAGLLCVGAPQIGALLHQPQLAEVLQALSPAVLITALMGVPQAILVRDLKMRELSLRSLVAAVVSSGFAVIAAAMGAGIWSLVLQVLLEATIASATAWWLVEYRPKLGFHPKLLAPLLSWGAKVTGIDVLRTITAKSDDLLIGVVLGAGPLGVYTVAYRLLTQINEVVSQTSHNVSFSALARLQTDRVRLSEAWLRVSGVLFAVVLPVFAGVAVMAPTVVNVAFGAQWSAAAPVMTLLAVYGVPLALTDASNTFLQSVGRAGRALAITVLSTSLVITGFVVSVHFGIVALAASLAISGLVVMPIAIRQTSAIVPGLAGDTTRRLTPIALCGLIPIGLLLLVRISTDSSILRLISLLPLGAFYAVLLRLAARPTWLDAVTFAGPLTQRWARFSARKSLTRSYGVRGGKHRR